MADVVARQGDQLAGKVVVDITNPVDFQTFDSLTVPADGTAAAELAVALRRSAVLKAFNTTFAAALVAGTVGELPTTVLIAVDDEDAKALLTLVVTDADCWPSTPGALKRARELEALGFLQITVAAGEEIPWSGGFVTIS